MRSILSSETSVFGVTKWVKETMFFELNRKLSDFGIHYFF